MNATKANLINSISLITIGMWGYFDVLSPTALIPVSIGVFLLACYSGLKIKIKLFHCCFTHIYNFNALWG